MRIVIDLQGAQATNAKRGIGQYSLSLTKALIRNAKGHEIILALNGAFPNSVTHIRNEFNDFLPQENIRIWQIPVGIAEINPQNFQRRQMAECFREAFLASLQPDIIHISSLFEGLVDDAVTSIRIQEHHVANSVTLYDLIPFIHKKIYLENPLVESWYERKLDHLQRSSLCLAISESSRLEGINHLGLSEDRIVNISTAVEQQFRRVEITSQDKQILCYRYSITKPFIMYTGGIDHRKNIEGLIRAFSLLPKTVRRDYQLAIICSIHDDQRAVMQALIMAQGLSPEEVIFTGYIPEKDLINLYNICHLFVFPSWHEGFGLPILEAMSCGAATIGGNLSSIPEVIGKQAALFNPHSDVEIAAKIQQVLTDENFRQSLKSHSVKQAEKFSWDTSAKRALNAFENLYIKNQYFRTQSVYIQNTQRPKLAFVSPVPNAKTGIADYSAELLPVLSRYYQIDIITSQDKPKHSWIQANCQIRTIQWFKENYQSYDRVLYHFGNSDFHQHMFELLEQYPGVVVLHDFFLSGIIAHMEFHHIKHDFWIHSLYDSHGYHAVKDRLEAPDASEVIYKYPCNLNVLEQALGVIVHSEFARKLTERFYSRRLHYKLKKIPHLRHSAYPVLNKKEIRAQLDFSEQDFIICSFGFLGPTKQNHRLLDAWSSSKLSSDFHCHLVFVGECCSEEAYGQKILTSIENNESNKRIHITGYLSSEDFQKYLAIANVAVQLRTQSRGETSGTILDCMNYELPIIVNANGAMTEFPQNCVYLLPDLFSDEALKNALEILWYNKQKCMTLAKNAKQYLQAKHSPQKVAEQYANIIEEYYQTTAGSIKARLLKSLNSHDSTQSDEIDLLSFAKIISVNHTHKTQKQLLIDISELVQRDAKTGIQRVTRNILRHLLQNPPNGYRVEPVYASCEQPYRYARKFTMQFLGCPENFFEDDIVEPDAGDIFLGLDLQPQVIPAQNLYFENLYQAGVKVYFVVYDLIPVLYPHYFPLKGDTSFNRWLNTISRSNGAICISQSVGTDLKNWINIYAQTRSQNFNIGYFHLGADIEQLSNTDAQINDLSHTLQKIQKETSFLMVGTIEPRKGYKQVLEAFEILWSKEYKINLIIVGKQGWMVEVLVDRLEQHPEKDKQLFWLKDIDDTTLVKIYENVDGVIVASEAEGFGLPLIESAQHKRPILARDIPVFREVANDHASYFPDNKNPETLAIFIESWLEALKGGHAPMSDHIPYLTWAESAQQLTSLILNEHSPNWLYQLPVKILEEI